MSNREWKRPGSSKDKAHFERDPTFPPEGEEDKYNCRFDSGRMKKVTCPECNVVHDAWTGGSEDASEPVKPEPGSIIICSECGSINELTEDWKLEKADLDELAEAMVAQSEVAQALMLGLMQVAHMSAVKKQILALQEKCRQYYKDGDVEFAKKVAGIDIPPGSKVGVLDQSELRMVYNRMCQTGEDQIGVLKKSDIEEMFEAAGVPLKHD